MMLLHSGGHSYVTRTSYCVWVYNLEDDRKLLQEIIASVFERTYHFQKGSGVPEMMKGKD